MQQVKTTVIERRLHPSISVFALSTFGAAIVSLAAGQYAVVFAVTHSTGATTCQALTQLLQPTVLIAGSGAIVSIITAAGTAISVILRGNQAIRGTPRVVTTSTTENIPPQVK